MKFRFVKRLACGLLVGTLMLGGSFSIPAIEVKAAELTAEEEAEIQKELEILRREGKSEEELRVWEQDLRNMEAWQRKYLFYGPGQGADSMSTSPYDAELQLIAEAKEKWQKQEQAAAQAQSVSIRSGASTYTFSATPVAAFEVTGRGKNPIILYCLPINTQIHSQAGSSGWVSTYYSNYEATGSADTSFWYADSDQEERPMGGQTEEGQAWHFQRNSKNLANVTELEELIAKGGQLGVVMGDLYEIYDYKVGMVDMAKIYDQETGDESDILFPVISYCEIYHSDVPGVDAINFLHVEEDDDYLSLIPAAFAYTGCTAVQIPVETALAMDNANVQNSTTQPADAQAAEAQAAAEAQVAAQTQIAPQQTSVAQETYTVEANDNLCKIAQKVYGDMKAWREIYKANPMIKDDYTIYKGQVLVIPAR